MNAPARRLVTLPVNGAWQPVSGKPFQYEDRTADFYCYPSRFVVDVDYPGHPDIKGTTFHGMWWDHDSAKRYALSCDGWSGARGTVREVEMYWYQPTYGRVTTEETREETVSAREQGL